MMNILSLCTIHDLDNLNNHTHKVISWNNLFFSLFTHIDYFKILFNDIDFIYGLNTLILRT